MSKHVVAIADLANLRPVFLDRRHDAAARAHHRLGDKSGDRVGAVVQDFFFERGRAVEIARRIGFAPRASVAIRRIDLRPIEQDMLVVGAASAAAGRQRCNGIAVIGESAPDDLALRSLAASLVIENRKLQRRFDRLRSAAGEEEPREPRGSPSRETIDQLLALGRSPDRHDVVEIGDRARGDLGDFAAALPDVHHHGAASRVEDLVAVRGVEPGALSALDADGIVRTAHEHRCVGHG